MPWTRVIGCGLSPSAASHGHPSKSALRMVRRSPLGPGNEPPKCWGAAALELPATAVGPTATNWSATSTVSGQPRWSALSPHSESEIPGSRYGVPRCGAAHSRTPEAAKSPTRRSCDSWEPAGREPGTRLVCRRLSARRRAGRAPAAALRVRALSDGDERPEKTLGKAAKERSMESARRIGKGQTVVGRGFYVFDEDRRHALEWGAELGHAAESGAPQHSTGPELTEPFAWQRTRGARKELS